MVMLLEASFQCDDVLVSKILSGLRFSKEQLISLGNSPRVNKVNIKRLLRLASAVITYYCDYIIRNLRDVAQQLYAKWVSIIIPDELASLKTLVVEFYAV
jgi:hypothetical protein